MDSRTDDLYPSKRAALDASVPEADLVEMLGVDEVIRRVRLRLWVGPLKGKRGER